MFGHVDFHDFTGTQLVICHSAKGSTWEKHKYVKKADGKYYYPSSYEGGRNVNTEKSKEAIAKAKNLIKGERDSEKGTELDLDKVYEVYGGKNGKKSEKKLEKKENTSKALTKAKELAASGDKDKNSGGSKKSSEEAKKKPEHIVKDRIDPKDKKAVLARINESLGRKSKSSIKAKSGQKKSSKKEGSENDGDDVESKAEELVNELEEAKDIVADLKERLKDTKGEERIELQREIREAQQDVSAVKSKINKMAKKTKGLRQAINSMQSG